MQTWCTSGEAVLTAKIAINIYIYIQIGKGMRATSALKAATGNLVTIIVFRLCARMDTMGAVRVKSIELDVLRMVASQLRTNTSGAVPDPVFLEDYEMNFVRERLLFVFVSKRS